MKRIFLLTLLSIITLSSFAATNIFIGKGGKIDTFAAGNYFPLHVKGLSPARANDSFGLEYVNVKINCANTNTIYMCLLSPSGGWYVLTNQNGNGKNFDSTIFTDTANRPLNFGKSPFKGSYTPLSFLKEANRNLVDTGIWYLYVFDNNLARKDVLVNWSLGFGTNPLRDVKLDSSKLPILVINTQGKPVAYDDPMTNCKFYVIENKSGGNNYLKDSSKYLGYCGIKQHGNWSRSFPKQSYNITTYDASYVKKNMPLLGMPKENDWILLANFLDKTLMRNALAHHIFAGMGNYSPRFRHVELVLNGRYQGVYLIAEKIKIDKNRVNIPKMDTTLHNSGDSLTGGYLFKQDWKGNLGWSSKISKPDNPYWYPYLRFVNPDYASVQQSKYLESYYDSFENYLYNTKITDRPNNLWKNYFDEKSLIDYFLVNELSNNIDGYTASLFFWKDRNSKDKHIHIGPVWDHDLSFGNYSITRFQWFFNRGYSNADFWWFKLLGNKYPLVPKSTTAWYNYGPGDSTFMNNVKCQWLIYRKPGGIMNKTKLDAWVDSNATYLSAAESRNINQWPTRGWNHYVYDAFAAKTYKQEIDSFKGWISDRLGFMDKFMPGTCRRDVYAPTLALIGKDTVKLAVFNSFMDPGITYNDNYGVVNLTINKASNVDTSKIGTYSIKYIVTDKAGNFAKISRTVLVIDTIKPIIKLTIGDTVKVEVNEVYNDTNIQISDNYDKNPTLTIGGTFNFKNNKPNKTGFFTKTVLVIDQSKNKDSATIILDVRDRKPPFIFCLAGDTQIVGLNQLFFNPYVKMIDNYDKNPKLSFGNGLKSIKTDKTGYFSIWYKATDFSFNSDSIPGMVKVIDTTAPIISLIGNDTVKIKNKDNYTDFGYLASDNYDKTLLIDTFGTFKNAQLDGLYDINYTATDLSGNKSKSVKRIIQIENGVGINTIENSISSIFIQNDNFYIKIQMNVNKKELVQFKLINLDGKIMYSDSKYLKEGNNNILINQLGLSSGCYIVQIYSPTFSVSKKLILMK